MIKTMKFLMFLLVISLASACSTTPLTPSQVAQHFWAAVLVEDNDAAKQYTRSSVQDASDLPVEVQDTTVRFGEVRIKSDQAAIDTTLEFKNAANPREASFVTYLEREASQWRVDLKETKKSLEKSMEKRGLNKLVDDLRKLGKDFTTQIDAARQNWEQSQPEIKKDLEELGQSVQEEVEGAIDKLGPEIERNVQDLQESIDRALKELERSIPEKSQPDPKIEPEGRMI